MGWKNWPYWLKGGIIGATIGIFLVSLFLYASEGEEISYPDILLWGGYLFTWIPSVRKLFFDISQFTSYNYNVNVRIIGGPFFYILLGLIIGLIIGKIKNRK